MKVVFGLGNVGKEYENTNHNAGFIVVQKCLQELGVSKCKKMCDGMVYETNLSGEKVYFVLPTTFMNNSGFCVASFLKKFDVGRDDFLVVVDDIDLPASELRIRKSGSAGTHNGLKSIISCIGSDFSRLRVGVGKPHQNQTLIDFVLSKMDNSAEQQQTIENAKNCVLEFVRGKTLDNLMQKYN